MCIACGAESSSPLVSTFTVAVFPLSCTLAFPVPVTWLVGTPSRVAGNVSAAFAVDDLSEEEPPELRATTAAMAPPTSTTAAAIHQRPPSGPRLPAGFDDLPDGDCGGGVAAAGAGALAAGAG